MDPIITGSLINAGTSILGGLMGGGTSGASKEARHIAYDTWKTNKDLAYNGVKIRVADAKEAGVHPAIALGLPGHSVPGTVVGDTSSSNRRGDAFRELGQGVSRAVEAAATKEDRLLARTSAALAVKNQQLQNDRLASEIALMNSSRTPGITRNPHMPGQGDVVAVPKEIVANTGSDEKGVSPSRQVMNYKGYRINPMSQALADAGMDEGPANWVYQGFNVVPQMFGAEADLFTKRTVKKLRDKSSYRDWSRKGYVK